MMLSVVRCNENARHIFSGSYPESVKYDSGRLYLDDGALELMIWSDESKPAVGLAEILAKATRLMIDEGGDDAEAVLISFALQDLALDGPDGPERGEAA